MDSRKLKGQFIKFWITTVRGNYKSWQLVEGRRCLKGNKKAMPFDLGSTGEAALLRDNLTSRWSTAPTGLTHVNCFISNFIISKKKIASLTLKLTRPKDNTTQWTSTVWVAFRTEAVQLHFELYAITNKYIFIHLSTTLELEEEGSRKRSPE